MFCGDVPELLVVEKADQTTTKDEMTAVAMVDYLYTKNKTRRCEKVT